jgi:hypothetical protein
VQPRTAGHPAYTPSDSDRATVQSLAVLGATHEGIALCLGDHGVSEKTLRKHFRRELDVSVLKVQALAASKVVAAIGAGEAWAICFYLKCKAGWREKSALDEVSEITVKRLVGVAIEDV